MTASLTLTYGALNLTASPYAVVFGMGTGAPENEVVPLASFIQDGDIELSSRAGNRTIAFDVLIEGASLTAMATAEANLISETERAFNTLTVDPGDSAPAAVYEIFRGQVSLARDDDGEVARIRRYTVTVRALPYPRSATETVTAALPATGSTTTNLDTCSATTGWTGTINGGAATPTTSGGSVIVTQAAAFGAYTLTLQKTFAATTTSTKYLVVDWQPSVFLGGTSSDLVATGDGVVLPVYATAPSPTAGYVRVWFYVAASSLAVTSLSWTSSVNVYQTFVAPARVLKIDNVAVTNVNPSFGTGRQQIRTVPVTGSARTPASLAIESSGTLGLGDTFVYTYPADDTTKGYVPSLRQFRTAGNAPTADAAMVSGSRESIVSPGITYTIPMGLLPDGSYLFYVRMAGGSAGNAFLTFTYQTTLGSNQLGTTVVNSAVYALTTSYQTILIDKLSLPTVDLDPLTPASLSINILSPYGGVVNLDEAWLFNVDIGRLIRVDCGSGTAAVGGPARRLFIEPATVATQRNTIRIGHSADRSDAYYPLGSLMPAWQFPEFKGASNTNIFYVTPNVTDAAGTWRAYDRWHTNPGH